MAPRLTKDERTELYRLAEGGPAIDGDMAFLASIIREIINEMEREDDYRREQSELPS